MDFKKLIFIVNSIVIAIYGVRQVIRSIRVVTLKLYKCLIAMLYT